MIGTLAADLHDGFRPALESAMGEPSRIPGFSRQRREILGRTALEREFIDRCRKAFMGLLPKLGPRGIVAVVSPYRGEGRSSVAAGVALAMASDTGASVVLMDLDFERPGLAQLFRVAEGPGLADYLDRGDRIRVVAGQQSGRLWLVPSGTRRLESARLCHQVAAGKLPLVCRELAEWVVLDLPPLLDNPEAHPLMGLADGFLLVGRYQVTPVAALERIGKLLPPNRPAGLVMTADSSRIPNWLRRLL